MKFCMNCGEPVEAEAAAEPETQQEAEPASEVATATAVAEPEEKADEAVETKAEAVEAETEAPKPKKKSPKKWIGIGVGAVALALVVAIVFNASFIWGSLVKLFGSDASYQKYVYKKAANSGVSDVMDVYDNILRSLGGNIEPQTVDGKMELSIGDSAKELLGYLIMGGGDMDLSFLDGLALDVKAVSTKDGTSYVLGLGSGDKKVATVEMMLSPSGDKSFVKIPEISDKWILMDMSQVVATGNTEMVKKLASCLPERAVLEKLLNKYIDVALTAIQKDNVEKKTEKLVVGDLRGNLTAITTTFDAESAADVVMAILEVAKDDKELEDAVKNFQNKLSEIENFGELDIEFWDELEDGIEAALDSLKEADFDSDAELKVTTYVNGKHEIMGIAIEANDQEVLKYITLEKGSKTGVVLEIGGETFLEGTLTIKRGLATGDLTVMLPKAASGMSKDLDLVTIRLTNFDTELEEGETLTGKVEIILSEDVLDQMGSVASILEPAISFEFTKDGTNIELINNGEKILGVKFTGKATEGGSVSMPSDDSAIDISDQDALREWIKTISLDELFDNVRELDLPSEFEGMIDEIEEEANDWLDSSSAYVDPSWDSVYSYESVVDYWSWYYNYGNCCSVSYEFDDEAFNHMTEDQKQWAAAVDQLACCDSVEHAKAHVEYYISKSVMRDYPAFDEDAYFTYNGDLYQVYGGAGTVEFIYDGVNYSNDGSVWIYADMYTSGDEYYGTVTLVVEWINGTYKIVDVYM